MPFDFVPFWFILLQCVSFQSIFIYFPLRSAHRLYSTRFNSIQLADIQFSFIRHYSRWFHSMLSYLIRWDSIQFNSVLSDSIVFHSIVMHW
jgi:hypothetical protein